MMQNPSSTGHDTHYTLNYSGVSITGAETYGHTIQPSTSGYHSHGLSAHHPHHNQGLKRSTQQAGLDKGVSLGLSSDEDENISASGPDEHSPYIIPSQVPLDVNVSCASMNDGRSMPNSRSLTGNSPSNEMLHPPTSKGTVGPNGKKTKGRVKIKMEFIDNKLRRYTTFSKRKTGIMKKAYELSTLTGTQVMLLVASETGHVYTFATRKLQPMITSEAGKALIQTCLNSPDPSPDHRGADQRMTPSGFEETELSYSVNDEDQKSEPHSPKSDSSDSTNDSSIGYESLHKSNQSKSDGSHVPIQINSPNALATLIPSGCSNSNVVSLPGTVMYHTAQGVVYASPSGNHLQHSLILEDGGARTPILTVPVPISLSSTEKSSSKAKK